MHTTGSDKRTRLIDTAVKLSYRNGFRETSLADIAEAAHVPVGNVYYYFKTKGELGEAVVEHRLAEFRKFREALEELSSPKDRLLALVDSIYSNRKQLVAGGCPLGSLCSELQKEGGRLAKVSSSLFTEPISWLQEQFRAAGKGRNSRAFAVHLFTSFQGIAAVAYGTEDPALVAMEVKELKNWLGNVLR